MLTQRSIFRNLHGGFLLLLLGLLAACTPQDSPDPNKGELIFSWDFDHGLPPDGWGWGTWRIVNGALEGEEHEDLVSAYFLPFTCPPDYMIDVRVMIMERFDHDANAQLLVRNNPGVAFESGIRLYAERDSLVVRHRAWRKDLILEWLPSPVPLELGVWHDLSFGMVKGRLRTTLDGVTVPLPELRVPVTEYHEPHLSVDRARVKFDDFRIYRIR
jgi:hypothetical protein